MSKEAMKLALEALEVATTPFARDRQEVLRAQVALREALAEQPAQQEPEHIVHSNGRYSPLLTRMMNKRAESNVKQVIHLYDEPHTQPAQQGPVAWRPDVCPITGLPFFMWIEHHETGQNVPTYGGPYDSYTIPVRDKDGSYCRERYDHDLGGWRTDEVEDVGIQIVSDQAYVSDDEPPASKPWVGLDHDDIHALMNEYFYEGMQPSAIHFANFARAIEAKLKEKNT